MARWECAGLAADGDLVHYNDVVRARRHSPLAPPPPPPPTTPPPPPTLPHCSGCSTRSCRHRSDCNVMRCNRARQFINDYKSPLDRLVSPWSVGRPGDEARRVDTTTIGVVVVVVALAIDMKTKQSIYISFFRQSRPGSTQTWYWVTFSRPTPSDTARSVRLNCYMAGDQKSQFKPALQKNIHK